MWVLNGIMAKILLAVIWVLIAGRLGIVFATGNTGSTRWSSVDYVYVSSLYSYLLILGPCAIGMVGTFLTRCTGCVSSWDVTAITAAFMR